MTGRIWTRDNEVEKYTFNQSKRTKSCISSALCKTGIPQTLITNIKTRYYGEKYYVLRQGQISQTLEIRQ